MRMERLNRQLTRALVRAVQLEKPIAEIEKLLNIDLHTYSSGDYLKDEIRNKSNGKIHEVDRALCEFIINSTIYCDTLNRYDIEIKFLTLLPNNPEKAYEYLYNKVLEE